MSWFCYDCHKRFEWTDEEADEHYDKTKHDMEFQKDDTSESMKGSTAHG